MSGESTTGMEEETREEIDGYRFFGYLLGFPSRERFHRITQDGFQEAIGSLWTGAGCLGQYCSTSTFDGYEQYEACYISLFDVGIPGPPVPLLESFYHEAIPAQQTVLENAWFYDVIGLKTNASIGPADHLLAQIEFCASVRYLQDACGAEPQRQALRLLERDFLDRHLLSWLPGAAAKLQESRPPAFPAWFALLVQFLRMRRDGLGSGCCEP